MKKSRGCFFLLACWALSMPVSLMARPAILGVLEEPQCKEHRGFAIRALFVRKDGHWIAIADQSAERGVLSAEMEWLVGFDGNELGSLKTSDPGFDSKYAWTYRRDRLLNIVSGQRIPTFPNKSHLFGGWCEPPTDRPLVAVINGGTSDPDRWQPFKPDEKVMGELFADFKQHVSSAVICPAQPDSPVLS